MSQASAYFDIIARTDSIKKAVAQAEVFVKEAKTKIEAIKIKASPLDTSEFKAGLKQMERDAEMTAAQIRMKLADSALNERANRITSILQQRRAREEAALPGQVAASIPFDPNAEARSRFAATGGGAAGIAGGGARGPEGLLNTFIKVGVVLKAVEGTIKVINGGVDMMAGHALVAAGNWDKGLQKMASGARAWQSIPVVGNLLEMIGGDFAGDIEKRRAEALEGDEKMKGRLVSRKARNAAFGKELGGLRIAGMRGGIEQDRAASQQQLDEALAGIDERLASKEISAEQANQLRPAQRSAAMRRTMNINERQDDLGYEVRQRYAQGENIDLRMAGRGREADRRELRLRLEADQRAADRALGSRDLGTEKLNESKLAEFDLNQKREIVARNAEYEASIRETNLRAAGESYAADRAAFEAAWDAKIQKIKESGDAEEVALAQRQRTAETEARQAESKRTKDDLVFQASQIRMKTAGKERTAEIEAIARETEKAIKAADPENRAAVGDVGKARLEAIDKQLQIAQSTTRAEVYASGSFRSLSGGIDAGKETVDVLRNNIAVSLKSIDSKIATSGTPTAG